MLERMFIDFCLLRLGLSYIPFYLNELFREELLGAGLTALELFYELLRDLN
jgi:hypothetical protein